MIHRLLLVAMLMGAVLTAGCGTNPPPAGSKDGTKAPPAPPPGPEMKGRAPVKPSTPKSMD
jgi:hypothetical protein